MMLLCNPGLLNRRKVLALAAVFGLAAACSPSAPKKEGAATSSPAPAANPQANLDELTFMALSSPLRWDFTEGVTVSQAAEDATVGGSKAVALTATETQGFHRLGVAGNYGEGKRTYRVKVWVKGSPGVDAMLEARGGVMKSPSEAADYGRSFFDLAKTAQQPNPMNTQGPNFSAVSIVQDGDWKLISVDMTTQDGWLYFVVNMTANGKHVFAGKPGMTLTLGGIEASPLS